MIAAKGRGEYPRRKTPIRGSRRIGITSNKESPGHKIATFQPPSRPTLPSEIARNSCRNWTLEMCLFAHQPAGTFALGGSKPQAVEALQLLRPHAQLSLDSLVGNAFHPSRVKYDAARLLDSIAERPLDPAKSARFRSFHLPYQTADDAVGRRRVLLLVPADELDILPESDDCLSRLQLVRPSVHALADEYLSLRFSHSGYYSRNQEPWADCDQFLRFSMAVLNLPDGRFSNSQQVPH